VKSLSLSLSLPAKRRRQLIPICCCCVLFSKIERDPKQQKHERKFLHQQEFGFLSFLSKRRVSLSLSLIVNGI
jgi:hypothetical protein